MREVNQAAACTSALIKTIRLRKVEPAAAYLGYLWNLSSDAQRRVRRRLLICSAEDNTSFPVISRVSAWFQQDSPDLKDCIREMLRIQMTPNWYASVDGRAYIRCWWGVEESGALYSEESQDALQEIVREAARRGVLVDAIRAFSTIVSRRNYDRWAFSDCLRAVATDRKVDVASRLIELQRQHMQALWWDTNFSGQALYTSFSGPIGPQDDVEVEEREVEWLVQKANAQRVAPAVPSWCLDGIHVPGSDPRFSGSLKHMAAACTAFEKFGRLSPEDTWGDDSVFLTA
jgi:hypothetical protein